MGQNITIPPNTTYKNGKIYVRFRKVVGGKEYQKSVSFPVVDSRSGYIRSMDLQQQFRLGLYDPWTDWEPPKEAPKEVKVTIRQLAEDFKVDYAKRGVKKTTYRDMVYCLESFCSYVGWDKSVDWVKSDEGKQRVSSYIPEAKGNRLLKKATIATYYRYVNLFLRWAYDKGYLSKLTLLKKPKVVYSPKFLEPDQVELCAEYLAKTDSLGAYILRDSVYIAYYSGMRLSEMVKMQVGDVSGNATGMTFHIGYGFSEDEAFNRYKATKSSSPRSIPVHPKIRDIVQYYRVDPIDGSPRDPTQLLLPPWCLPEHYSKSFKKALRKVLPYKSGCNWKSLRSSCGMRMLQDEGASLEVVSKWLGHASIRTTQTHYASIKAMRTSWTPPES